MFVVQLLGGASIPCEAIIFLNLIVSAFVSSTSPFLADIDNACQIVIKGQFLPPRVGLTLYLLIVQGETSR